MVACSKSSRDGGMCLRSWAAAAAIRRAPFKARGFHVQLVAEALAQHLEDEIPRPDPKGFHESMEHVRGVANPGFQPLFTLFTCA